MASTICAGAITVSQWQRFSSWRTLPGKSTAPAGLQRRVGDALGLDAELARALLQEVARQQRDVLAPLAQRRQAQADDVEAMEQVLAERALACTRSSRFWWVAAMTRTLAFDRLVAADAVELAVGQHAQQPRLQVERHVADLVEEQRAAVGLLEAAAAHRLRAGEGAALVAEQLATRAGPSGSPRC